MNISPSVYQKTIHFFEQNILPTLNAQHKKIAAIVAIAFSCLASAYLLYYFSTRNWKVGSSEAITEPKNIPQIAEKAKLDYQQGIKTFSFEVLQNKLAKSQTDNHLISPLGISLLLSMIKHGVGAEDQAEIERIIHLPQSEDELKVSAYELIKKLMSNGLNIAGLLYLNSKYRLNPTYQSSTSQFYQSLVASGSSADQVNAWVKKATNGQMEEIITQNDLIDFYVVLANAIHFKANWSVSFNSTHIVDFVTPTQTIEMEMMRKTDRVEYFDDEDCQAIRLSYQDSDCSMLLILPKKENDFSFIDDAKFEAISQGLKATMVEITLPKFKLEQEVDVKVLLEEMGIDHLFKKPDFLTMVDRSHPPTKNILPELSISQMKQKSSLECDEKGTEASTVTVATLVAESCAMPLDAEKAISFDHPFLAALITPEIPILFSVVRDPSANKE